MIIRDDERAALILLLLKQRRSLEREQQLLEERKRRIAVWASSPGPLEARLVHIVAEDLATSYGLHRAAYPSLAVRLVNRLRMVGAVREATAAAELKNVGWAREDAIHGALAEVHVLVAARTGGLLRYVTEEDDRVCSHCAPLHGNVYTPSQAPKLPRHPRCRCWLVAINARVAMAA